LETVLSYLNLAPSNSDEEKISVIDILAEYVNMIMGKFTKTISHLEDYIYFGTPITLFSQQAKISHSSTEIWTSLLESDKGNIEINYINSIE